MFLRYLIWALALSSWLPAQEVAAPEFLCTRPEAGGEILTWANVSDSCGAYQATEIYRSTAEAGPYTLLATLTDPTTTEYRDENPTGEQFFYYLRYRYDCPGSTTLSSDTLDNRIPAAINLRYVSVEDGDLLIGWDPSPSPEVSGYVILEVTDTGTFPLDTVGDETTYRVTDVPVDSLTARDYVVVAIDPCGNDTPQSQITSAVGLTGSGGQGCISEVSLVRTTTGTSTLLDTLAEPLRLYASVDGGPFTEEPYELGAADTLIYDGGNDGETICFYQEGTYATGETVRTDTFCITLAIIPPIRPFDVYGIEVNGGAVRLPFETTDNPLPVAASLELYRGITVEEISIIPESFSAPELNLPFSGSDQVLIDSARLLLQDECGDTLITNAVSPVYLFAEPAPGGATLDWTPLVNNLAGTITYAVLAVNPDGSFTPLADSLTDLTYLDQSPPPAGGPRCYRIAATYTPVDSVATFSFLSNQACLFEEPEVFFPNAFSPTAQQPENRVFGPIFGTAPQLASYEFFIFDRWGALVFSSDQPGLPWSGFIGSTAAPTGSYLYTLSYTTPTGNLSRRTGVVHLIR
ncbi:gliding motility-associated C-terminal domain-containing protein [Neolewinella sp.]|uniref:T9SS type B sorting domain-containing protein n=1 Tax=Neolewinella sp. TaxID=2993543 RepID=UPI003B52F554